MSDEQAIKRATNFLSGTALEAAEYESGRIGKLTDPTPTDADRAAALKRWLAAGAVLHVSLAPDPRPE